MQIEDKFKETVAVGLWKFAVMFLWRSDILQNKKYLWGKICSSNILRYISKIIDISPGNLDSSLCFFQPSITHDVFCIQVK